MIQAVHNRPRGIQMPALRTVALVWIGVGLGPFILQLRGFSKFAMPHRISERLITPQDAVMETAEMHTLCPVKAMFIAGAYWSVTTTHYFRFNGKLLCHCVGPQYNVHGNYIMGSRTAPQDNAPASCADQTHAFEGNFYHGSIGYYAIYAEARGTYCGRDNVAYIVVKGDGTYDINGARLARDRGSTAYRKSYWYICTGVAFISFRCFMLRRSFVSCRRFATRCDQMSEPVRLQEAVVFVQESMRLSAHGARNYHRLLILFLILDQGVMSDFFLLSTHEGWFGRVQSISLGYNLSSVMSMLFEMVEAMNWLGEKRRCQLKRLLFNYETVLIGELICAGLLQHYLTSLSRSKLKDTEPLARAVSHYVMGLMGHIVIALGSLSIIILTRTLGAIGFVWMTFGSVRVLTKSCSVDTALGPRSKLVLLGGYLWENQELFYKPHTLKAFGIFKTVEDDGTELAVHTTLDWIAIPKNNLVIIGTVLENRVVPCSERLCSGTVSLFDRVLGGTMTNNERRRSSLRPRLAMLTIKVHSSDQTQVVNAAMASNIRRDRGSPRSTDLPKDARLSPQYQNN